MENAPLSRSKLRGVLTLIAGAVLALAVLVTSAQSQAFDTRTADQLAAIERLVQSGNLRRAESLLSRLIRTAPTNAAAAPFQQALAALYRHQPLQWRGSVALRPSTNITRAASASQFFTNIGVFDINDGGAPTSGFGLKVSGGGTYRLPLDRGRTLDVTALLDREWYAHRDLRHVAATLRADLVSRSAGQTLRYGAYVTHRHYDGEDDPTADRRDFTRIGLRGLWSQDTEWSTRTLATTLEHRNYLDQDARDAMFASAAADWSKSVGPAGRLSWGLGLNRLQPSLDYQRYWGADGRLGYTHRLSDVTRVGATFGLSIRHYDTDFASVDYAREDTILRIGLTASDSRIRIAGAVPLLSCTYTDHRSNITLYQTDYTDCGVSFSFDF